MGRRGSGFRCLLPFCAFLRLLSLLVLCDALRFREVEGGVEAGEAFGVVGEGVGLGFVLDLKAVLDGAEMAVGVDERLDFVVREEVELVESAERFESVAVLEKRVPGAVEDLEGLGNEFDFADVAVAEFYVSVEMFVADDLALDAAFDRSDFLNDVEGDEIGRASCRERVL